LWVNEVWINRRGKREKEIERGKQQGSAAALGMAARPWRPALRCKRRGRESFERK